MIRLILLLQLCFFFSIGFSWQNQIKQSIQDAGHEAVMVSLIGLSLKELGEIRTNKI